MGYRPRPYQAECIDSIFHQWEEHASTLVVAATGTGKTVIFSGVMDRFTREKPVKALALVHREELAFQAKEKIEETTGQSVQLEMGDWRAGRSMYESDLLYVASVQSLSQPNRLSRYRPEDFGLLIWDEAHHCHPGNKTYESIRRHFQQNPALKMLGVTATPDRSDEVSLGQFFESVAYEYDILNGIQDGYLVPIRQQMCHIEDLDLSGVKTVAGDLSAVQLDEVMREEKVCQGVVSATRQVAVDRPTVVFAASVAHAHKMAEIFNRHSPGCASAIDGKTDKDLRRHELLRFRKGDIQFLCNVGVLTEGFDAPNVRVIANARPTKSRSLYCQIVGRGTRPLPGIIDDPAMNAEERRERIAASTKPFCTVIDFVGNAGRHKLITTADILGGKLSDEIVAEVKEKQEKAGKAQQDSDTLEDLIAARQERDERIRMERMKIIADAKFRLKEIDPFDLFDISARREPGYLKGKPATRDQMDYLRKNRVRINGNLSQHRASVLIDTIKQRAGSGLCTPQQASVLKRFGYPVDVNQHKAAEFIQEINKNLSARRALT